MDETNLPMAGGALLFQNVCAGNVGGHQIRRKLNSLKLEIENLGKRLNHQGFGESGHAFEQAVTARKKRHQHLIDYFLLTDNYFFELL